MAYRNIFIANEAKLKLKNNQLIVFNGEELSFPIEDIRSIVVDNPYVSLTGKLMAKLADDGVCLIICNDKHIPSCELLPIGSYCRMNKRINLQFSQSKPRLKKIWQKIVQAKINNQAKCLEINEIDEAQTLYSISKNVASGDTTNREGFAARLYFKSLFGDDFKRDDENSINAALNYGYAIFRSFIAKTIVASAYITKASLINLIWQMTLLSRIDRLLTILFIKIMLSGAKNFSLRKRQNFNFC